MFPRSRTRGLPALAAILLSVLAGCSNDASPPDDGGPTPPVVTAPTITGGPTSASVASGFSVTLSVGVSGTSPFTYQWRRDGVNIAGATGATYTTPDLTMGDHGAAFSVVVTNSAGSVTSGTAVITVTSAPGTTASIELEQSSALLTGAGQTVQLGARPVDAQGAPLTGAVTWESTDSSVAVSGTGLVTANAIGSALLFATANGVRSQPIYVIVAEPQPGALLLDDSQVIAVGPPLNLVPGAEAIADVRYEVTVSGVAPAPAPGTVVLAAGDAPVAGKVVSSRSEAGNLVLLIEVAPLPDVLARYDINWDIDLSDMPVEPIELSAQVTQAGTRTQKVQAARAGVEITCDREIEAGLADTTFSLTPQINAHFVIESARTNPSLPPGYSKLALVGSQSLQGTAAIKFSPQFEGSITCVADTSVPIGATGLAAVLFTPALRVGVGFTAGGTFKLAEGELKAVGTVGLQETLGFECTATACTALKTMTPIDDFKLTKTVPSIHQMSVELNGQFFALAGIDASFLLGVYDAQVIEARYGPKQTFELMHPDDQAHNGGAAAKYNLDMAGNIGPGSALRAAIKKLVGDDSVSLNFDVPFSTPIAESPKGTFVLSADRIAYGNPVAFQVVLDQNTITYPFVGQDFERAYNVDNVQIWRRKAADPDFALWQTLPASNGRATFQYEWTPTSADTGDWEFAAFTDTALPVPIVEVAEDSKRLLHVRGPGWAGNVTFTLEGTESTTETSSGPFGGTQTTVSTYTISGTGSYELETTPGQEGLPILQIGQASGTMTNGYVVLTDAAYVSNGCNETLNQTRERIETATLAKSEGTFVLISFLENGTYQLTIPFLGGPSSGTERVEATGTSSGAPDCRDPAPTNTTTTFNGNLSSAILGVTGVGTENARSLQGTAVVEFEGLPDHRYNVSWNLTR